MSSQPDPSGLHDADFETIEAAVNETVRGRWFLAEYARRNRVADTERVLEGIARVEQAVRAQSVLPGFDAERFQLAAEDIARKLIEISQQMRASRQADEICASLEAQALRVASLVEDATAPAAPAPPLQITRDPEPLRLEAPAEDIDEAERRLIEQRMIEPKPFLDPGALDDEEPAPFVAPLPPQPDLNQQIGRLSERLVSMRRFETGTASRPDPDPSPTLSDVDALPLVDRWRYFG